LLGVGGGGNAAGHGGGQGRDIGEGPGGMGAGGDPGGMLIDAAQHANEGGFIGVVQFAEGDARRLVGHPAVQHAQRDRQCQGVAETASPPNA